MPFYITKKKINNKFYYRVYCNVNDDKIIVSGDKFYPYKDAKRIRDNWNYSECNIAKSSSFKCPVKDIKTYLAIREYNLFLRLKNDNKKII